MVLRNFKFAPVSYNNIHIYIYTSALIGFYTDYIIRIELTMTSKKLVNVPAMAARDACEGLLSLRPDLASVEGNPCVIVRRDILEHKQRCVAVITGGGSGHEPAHAGFVGAGLLSAAVCGGVFSSPTVKEVLAAIRICGAGSPHGVLLIVKNYTGDRINFGLAMEQAIGEGIKTMMIIVDDDVALPEDKGITGGRGVAGTIFVHKVAGALSHSGKSLEEIHSFLSACVGRIGTMGVALTTCTVPGSEVSDRLADKSTMEVGLGIHGEPGRAQQAMRPDQQAEDAAAILVEAIVERKKLRPDKDELAVIINNLGGLSILELQIVSKFIIRILRSRGFNVHRALWGHYMTSLEMSGVSLSIFSIGVNDGGESFKNESLSEMLSFIDAPCKACGWNNNNIIPLSLSDNGPALLPYSPVIYLAKKSLTGGPDCSKAIIFVETVCNKLIEINKDLNHLDSLSGDGDCGVTMNNLALSIKSWLNSTREKNASEFVLLEQSAAHFLNELASQVSSAGGGTSGVLLELFLRAMCSHFVIVGGVSGVVSGVSAGSDAITLSMDWVAAMWKGCDAISMAGGARVGMRTMLDALIPGLEALRRKEDIATAAFEARKGMETTKDMDAKAGRANYVPREQFQGYPDPGSVIVAEIFGVALACFS